MPNDRAQVAIVGVGESNFSELFAVRDASRDPHQLAADALTMALADAGLAKEDLDGLITARVGYERVAAIAGLRDLSVAFGLDESGRMSGIAVQQATALIRSGVATTIALVYGTTARSARVSFGGDYGEAAPTARYDALYGMTSPGAYTALMYRRYCELYGAEETSLAPLAISNRHNASLNPGAVLGTPIDFEAYESSRYIAEPLRLFDYCVIADGGVALILTTAERARTLNKRTVTIAATAASTDISDYYVSQDLYYGASQRVAAKLREQSGLGPEDMDCVQVYDNFAPIALFSLEGFGHAPRGEGWRWIAEGATALDGAKPVNTSGGHTGEGYLQGWALHVEAVRQVRGECGERQIVDCDTVQYICASPVVTSHILVGA